MSKKIKKYIVNADESDVFAISLVETPAVNSDFIMLSKQRPIMLKDEAKHMLYGCALRTDFPIYRNSKEYGEYYLEFSKEAVEKMARRFMKNSFQNNWTEGHKKAIEGLTVVESWIKQDNEKDKSIALGFGEDCAIGSWFVGCYVDSNDIWEKVKKGEYKGFSVEALCGLDDYNFSKINNDMVDDETFWTKMKGLMREIFGLVDDNEIGQKELKQGAIATKEINLVEETPVINESPDDAKQSENENDDENENEKTPEIDDNDETPDDNDETPDDNDAKQPDNDNSHLEELINNLKAEIEALKEVNSGLQEKVNKLGKRPSVKPVNTKAKPDASVTYSAWREQMRGYIS